MTDEAAMLDAVFGEGPGDTPAARAMRSHRMFVRGLDLLTFDHSEKARGRRLTAMEAMEAYGYPTLCAVADEGSANITSHTKAVGRTLRDRRAQLGISVKAVARMSALPTEVVEAMEASARRPVREYERVARALGLDERRLSFSPVAPENERVAVRLRTLAADRVSLTSSTVVALAEASWVAMTQIRLEERLALQTSEYSFEPTSDFGTRRATYEVGYELATHFRSALGLGLDPIPSMRELVEHTLKIPVVQANLNASIAGATIESEGRRAIVLNVSGRNSDALIRRSTMAHELCHLLFDPEDELSDLRVDEYDEIEQRADVRTDRVEQRANAFSVQLLAPQGAAVERYERTGDLHEGVMDHFGISFTAARYQVWNGLNRSVRLEDIRAANRRPEGAWDAVEDYTLAYHPIRSLVKHPSRAGRFSAVVIRAATLGSVSWDTAAEWLYCSIEEAQAAEDLIRDLYPEVFEG